MKVSLTFDNGPHPATTPQVLSVLESRDVKASFFMLGERLQDDSGLALAAEVAAAGHQIGNHTFSHRMFGDLESSGDAVAEIERTQVALGELAGEARLFRPAGGGGQLGPRIMSRTAYDHLRANHYSCVLWNSVPRDWEAPDGWVATALADMETKDWTVLVLHDLPTGAMRNLRAFLDRSLDLGAEFTLEFPRDCTPIWRGEARWPMAMVEK